MTCLAVFLEQLDVTRDHDLDLFLDSLTSCKMRLGDIFDMDIVYDGLR